MLFLKTDYCCCIPHLKGEVEGHALNTPGNYIVDHGKSWNCVFEFLLEPCVLHVYKLSVYSFILPSCLQQKTWDDPLQWRSQNAEKAMHIKGRLLYQAMILYNYVPFQNRNFSQRNEFAPRGSGFFSLRAVP